VFFSGVLTQGRTKAPIYDLTAVDAPIPDLVRSDMQRGWRDDSVPALSRQTRVFLKQSTDLT